jgi:hypothetical protein
MANPEVETRELKTQSAALTGARHLHFPNSEEWSMT